MVSDSQWSTGSLRSDLLLTENLGNDEADLGDAQQFAGQSRICTLCHTSRLTPHASARTEIGHRRGHGFTTSFEKARDAVAVVCQEVGGRLCSAAQSALEDRRVGHTVTLGEDSSALDGAGQGAHHCPQQQHRFVC